MMVKEDILGDALIIHFLLQSVFIFELVRKGNSRFEIVQRQFSDLIIAQPVVL